MERTLNGIVREVTNKYISDLDMNNLPSPETIESELLTLTRGEIDIENAGRSKGDKITKPATLSFAQITDLMLALYPIRRIICTNEDIDGDYDLLAIYNKEGHNEGIYTTNEDDFYEIATKFNYQLSQRDFNEILNKLKTKAKRVMRTNDKDLIPVGNGIFNYATKQLLPFSEEYIFMTKSKVNYNDKAANPMIHNPKDNTDWDVESWMNEFSDDPEVINVLWEILGAIIRPNVSWNKSAWFYSESGNNGKGTLCELMRNLCGKGSYASIPISDFGKDFMLEPLTHSSAIIVDENDVGTFIDKVGNLKAVITNDVIQINRKYKQPIAYRFYGFMVQCLNEFPRIKDRSDSFYRRQLFVEFEKTFKGRERKYIKDEYLKRQDVLEYVLYKVLNMNYYSLSEPEACTVVLNEYKNFNDPVRLFYEDVVSECVWDLLPFNFLYDLYMAWFKSNIPAGTPISSFALTTSILNLIEEYGEWECEDKRKKIRPSNKMDKPEPLIAKYDLNNWKNSIYKGNDIDKLCKPTLLANYRGITRIVEEENKSSIIKDKNEEKETVSV